MSASSRNDGRRVWKRLTGPTLIQKQTPLVKICGLTRLEDAALAAALGAWAVGFVLAPSRRRLTPEQAAPLATAARAAALEAGSAQAPLTVGVFVDEPPEEIAAAVKTADLDCVQLHGFEPRAARVRGALGRAADHLLIIQALTVPPEGVSVADLRHTVVSSHEGADMLLFDTASKGRFGGTGASFPWELVREVAGDIPFLIAGGIGPTNARPALSASGAAGVDVSSGLESSPGVKDPDLLRALFAALHDHRGSFEGPRGATPAQTPEPSEGKRP